MRSLNPAIPLKFESLIGKAIQKDRNERYQTAAEIRADLETLRQDLEHRRSRWWTVTAGVILCIAITIVGAGIGLWLLRPASHPAPTTVPLTGYPGKQAEPAFSPDAKQVAFAWDGENGDNFDIYVKLLGAGAPLRLTTSQAEERSPAWSPDGRYIAFCRALPSGFRIPSRR